MINREKILKDMNSRLAHFGELDAESPKPLSPESITSSDLKRLYREMTAKLVFKIE